MDVLEAFNCTKECDFQCGELDEIIAHREICGNFIAYAMEVEQRLFLADRREEELTEARKLVPHPYAWDQETMVKSGDKGEGIPEYVFVMTRLTKLNWTNGLLTTVDRRIGYLSSLTTLKLDSNRITEIPPAIAYLRRLQVLSLTENRISSLEGLDWDALANLKELFLDGNQITAIPVQFYRLQKLRFVYLHNNLIEGPIHASISKLSKLKRLNLEENKVSSLPDSIGALVDLVELCVGYNQLTTLPHSLKQLVTLTRLETQNNAFPAGSELKRVALTHHNLQSLDW